MEPEAGSKTEGNRARLIVRELLNVRAALTLGARDRYRRAILCVSDDRAAQGERDDEKRDDALVQQSGGTEVPAELHRSHRHVDDGKRNPNGGNPPPLHLADRLG